MADQPRERLWPLLPETPWTTQEEWVNAGPTDEDLRARREATLQGWRELGYDTSNWAEEIDWTDDDEAAADRALRRLLGDPVE